MSIVNVYAKRTHAIINIKAIGHEGNNSIVSASLIVYDAIKQIVTYAKFYNFKWETDNRVIDREELAKMLPDIIPINRNNNLEHDDLSEFVEDLKDAVNEFGASYIWTDCVVRDALLINNLTNNDPPFDMAQLRDLNTICDITNIRDWSFMNYNMFFSDAMWNQDMLGVCNVKEFLQDYVDNGVHAGHATCVYLYLLCEFIASV